MTFSTKILLSSLGAAVNSNERGLKVNLLTRAKLVIITRSIYRYCKSPRLEDICKEVMLALKSKETHKGKSNDLWSKIALK